MYVVRNKLVVWEWPNIYIFFFLLNFVWCPWQIRLYFFPLYASFHLIYHLSIVFIVYRMNEWMNEYFFHSFPSFSENSRSLAVQGNNWSFNRIFKHNFTCLSRTIYYISTSSADNPLDLLCIFEWLLDFIFI